VSLAARRRAAAAGQTDVARRLGVLPGQPIVIDWPKCASAPTEVPADTLPPDLLQARFGVEAARAAADRARAARIPDIAPIAGLRRTAGYSGLLLGLSLELPLLRSGAAAEVGGWRRRRHCAPTWAEGDGTAQRRGPQAVAARSNASLSTTSIVRCAQQRAWQGRGRSPMLDARRARVNTLNEFVEWRATRRAAHAGPGSRPARGRAGPLRGLDMEIR
jgi:hypothetical protein